MKYYLVPFFLFLYFSVLSQKYLSYEQACADIDFYFAKMDSIHPDMYAHTPKAKIDSFILALKAKCLDSIESVRLGIELQQSNHFFDYHSTTLRGYRLYEVGKVYAFPRIQMKGNRVCLKDKDIEVLSINNVPIHRIRQTLLNTYSYDQHPAYISFEINHSLQFQRILMYMNILSPYSVQMKAEGKISTIVEQGENFWDMKAEEVEFWDEFYDNERPYSLQTCPDSSLAIIRFNRCVWEEKELAELQQFLNNSFRIIREKQINYLFIDVSRNEGGSSQSCDLFFPFIKTSEQYEYKLFGRTKSWNKKGKMKITKVTDKITLEKRDQGFDGKIFIYQSPYSCSAATYLGKILGALGLAVLVGTDTEPVIKNYIDSELFKLPYSGLSGRVSRFFYYAQRPEGQWSPQMGLMPDIPYPFLADRRLNFSDCMKIIRMYKLKFK